MIDLDDLFEFLLTYGWIFVILIIICAVMGFCVIFNHVEEVGLKSIVMSIWEGGK